ncbi:MAG: ParB/RepB/Spo0J family partition protein [bacterium]
MAVKRLGKGLGALIPDVPEGESQRNDRLHEVEISSVVPNPFQPRETFDPAALEELKQSISQNGVIQPITVREAASGYELIAGERRLRAVSELGLERIPAFILDVGTDEEMIELSLIENIQRENLNPVDEANGYRSLMTKCHLTQDQVAKKVGKDRSTVTNALRMLKLPKQIQESLIQGEISTGHARAILGLSGSNEQVALWKKAVKNSYSVRQVESLVKKANQPSVKPQKQPKPRPNPFLTEIEERIRGALSTQVRVDADANGKGRIEIEFYSTDDLERIVELLENKVDA